MATNTLLGANASYAAEGGAITSTPALVRCAHTGPLLAKSAKVIRGTTREAKSDYQPAVGASSPISPRIQITVHIGYLSVSAIGCLLQSHQLLEAHASPAS
jgi:hypothetical protein